MSHKVSNQSFVKVNKHAPHLGAPLLSDLMWSYHPVVLGSNPMHMFYAFSLSNFLQYLVIVLTKGLKQTKEADVGPYFNTTSQTLLFFS